jgi:hypothetical protein
MHFCMKSLPATAKSNPIRLPFGRVFTTSTHGVLTGTCKGTRQEGSFRVRGVLEGYSKGVLEGYSKGVFEGTQGHSGRECVPIGEIDLMFGSDAKLSGGPVLRQPHVQRGGDSRGGEERGGTRGEGRRGEGRKGTRGDEEGDLTAAMWRLSFVIWQCHGGGCPVRRMYLPKPTVPAQMWQG